MRCAAALVSPPFADAHGRTRGHAVAFRAAWDRRKTHNRPLLSPEVDANKLFMRLLTVLSGSTDLAL